MITFSKELISLNPAYNDSIVEFSSTTISGATKAVVKIEGNEFTCVPLDNKFTFNFKEVIKVLINPNRHEDTIIPDLTNTFIYEDESITQLYTCVFTIYGANGNESTTKFYSFIKAVEQLPNYNKLVNINPSIRALLPTDNYIDYYVKYFEGYPFDIAIRGMNAYYPYFFRNVSTNQETETLVTNSWDVTRFFMSDGANTTTETDIIVTNSALNKVELWVGNEFKLNLYIQKVESDCGVYLKWINSKGGYSYWKFDSVYRGDISTKVIEEFAGNYDNLQNLSSTSYILGKTAEQTLRLTTNFEGIYSSYLSDLFTSPSVWMYTHNEPFQKQEVYDFIGVQVKNGSFQNIDTKTKKGKATFTITLPQINTITN